MLTWPHTGTDWRDALDTVYPVFAQIGACISGYQTVMSICRDSDHRGQVQALLIAAGANAQRLSFALADSDDAWARDHGPLTTLLGDRPTLNDFTFNGWGHKYPASRDDALTAQLVAHGVFGSAEHVRHSFVLEGGAIETDGRGTLLATRSSVLTDTRNPGWELTAIEARLTEILGIRRFFWLDHGRLSGDDTDGHVDTLARFADRDTIVYATAPAGDEDHAGLAAMASQLSMFRSVAGEPYRLLPLPFPGAHHDARGCRLPASYANFLIINDAVLLPVYGAPADLTAEGVLAMAFPRRRIIPIDCRALIAQHGSLHCLTMQFPASVQIRP